MRPGVDPNRGPRSGFAPKRQDQTRPSANRLPASSPRSMPTMLGRVRHPVGRQRHDADEDLGSAVQGQARTDPSIPQRDEEARNHLRDQHSASRTVSPSRQSASPQDHREPSQTWASDAQDLPQHPGSVPQPVSDSTAVSASHQNRNAGATHHVVPGRSAEHGEDH